MSTCSPYCGGFEFPRSAIEQAVREGRLLSLEIEFTRVCNFRCVYCYVPREDRSCSGLAPEEARFVIQQAKDLGARKIIVLGGEPLLYPALFEMISFMRGLDLEVEMFTNGSRITADNARWLYDHGVRVVLKYNSRDPTIQDMLAGRHGAHAVIAAAWDYLRAAGYPAPGRGLGASAVIVRENIDDIIPLWIWLREQGVEPYVEMLTPQGNAAQNPWLGVPPEKIERLFHDVAAVDRQRFGRHWDPQPPLLGNRCLRHLFSAMVSASGMVFPCVGVTIPIGNIREQRLEEILRDSEVLQDLRNYRQRLHGPCRRCDRCAECYGCRGAAYQLTGDYLASDPRCWRHGGRAAEIRSLPRDAGELIPHRFPIRVVDTLDKVGERAALVRCRVRPDWPMVQSDGTVAEALFLELLAQAMAVANGFRLQGNGERIPEGLLLGVKNLVVRGRARVGDELIVSVFKEARFGSFGVVHGTVARNGDILAEGRIKVWHAGTDA